MLTTKQNNKVMGREKLFNASGSVLIKTTLVKAQALAGKGIVVNPDAICIKTSTDKIG